MSRQYQSWEVSDDFWQLVEPLVPQRQRLEGKEYKRRIGGGRKPMASRRVFEAIVFVLRTGIQWKALPREMGSGSAVHKYFQEWEQSGFFRSLWQQGLMKYDDLAGIDWEWQSIDGCKVESPLGQDAVGPSPVDRGKKRVRAALARGRSRGAAVAGRSGGEPA
jgi:transposase